MSSLLLVTGHSYVVANFNFQSLTFCCAKIQINNFLEMDKREKNDEFNFRQSCFMGK